MPAPPPAMRFVAAEAGFLPAGPAVVFADMVAGFGVGVCSWSWRYCWCCSCESLLMSKSLCLESPIPSIPVDSLGVFIVLFIPLGEIARPNETMRGKVR